MTAFSSFLHWTPRVLCLAFAAFLAMFALDVFGEHLGFWATLAALAMHLLPTTGLVLVVLALAWRWPAVGGVLLVLVALLYTTFVVRGHHPLVWIIGIAGPAFLVGVLFLADWYFRRPLRIHV
jgi:hypothetical protein